MTPPPAHVPVGLIWAEAREGVIGAQGGMPWHVPEDLAHFKAATLGAPVVMGRRTWESFPARFRPLPGRRNIVVTHREDWTVPTPTPGAAGASPGASGRVGPAGAERAASLEDALALATASGPERIWVIGGGQLYREAIALARNERERAFLRRRRLEASSSFDSGEGRK